tara:strand:- start:451 stop:1287 length:837 start_codon:yes stop_codon:yes gene_type:complete
MKAILLNLSAWTMLPIMDGIAKYLSLSLPVLQITWARYFFTVVIILPTMVLFFKKNLKLSEKPKLQIIRGLLLFVANILFFYSISQISLSKALTLAFIAPLIVTIFSPIFLNEKVGFNRWVAVMIGFFGCLIVIRPGLIDFNLATFAALGTGFMYGFYLIVTRKLSNVDNPLLTLLFTGIVGAFIGSFVIPFYWVMPSSDQWLFLFLIGFFASIGHLLLILSLKLADASKLAPFGYFEILPNIIIGYYFFNNVPDIFHLSGLVLIIGSGVYIFKKESF